MARGFESHLTYQESLDSPEKTYDLRVNHPLSIGNTDVFLIGHGYAPVITIRDGDGDRSTSGPTVFLPTSQSFQSIGVVKAPDAEPTQIGLEGEFYPTVAFSEQTGSYYSLLRQAARPDDLDARLHRRPRHGRRRAAVGLLARQVQDHDADQEERRAVPRRPAPGRDRQAAQRPRHRDASTGSSAWNKIQISQTPGKWIALTGVVMALIGLLGSLFIRPRRVWVRARREGDGTLVEVAALDRSGGGDVAVVVDELVATLQGPQRPDEKDES